MVELAPQVRRFADLRDVDDFLERLGSMMAEARQPSEAPVLASPFTLPAAFGYLDTVWQLKFGNPLSVPPGLERSARLVLDVATADEADTALSALAEVLKNLTSRVSKALVGTAPTPSSRTWQPSCPKRPCQQCPRR